MDVYGLQPVRESLVLAQCKLCKKPIRLSAFANHLDLCRRLTPSPPPSASVGAAAPQVAAAPPAAPAAASLAASSSMVEVMPRSFSGPVSVTVAPSNPAPVSSTRIGATTAVSKNRAPPTPPRLVKPKKAQKQSPKPSVNEDEDNNDEDDEFARNDNDDDDDEEEAFGDVQRQVTGRKTVPVRAAGPPVPPMLAMRSGVSDAHDRGRLRKEISVLEIRADNSDSNKVTIMVQSAAPVLTRAHRAGSAGNAAPLASRRWTRRNKLTGLSLSFKIRSDACDSDEEDEEEEEDEDDFYEGGDLSEGWAYTTQRRKTPRNDTEDAILASNGKRKGPPPQVNHVSAKRFFYGEEKD